MENLKIFKNDEFGEVRTLVIDDKPYFVGNDVAKALGYKNIRNVVPKHVDKDDRLRTQIEYVGQSRSVTVINESGVYSLIFGSKLESAKDFKRWVTSEVLPTIRKTGGYINNDQLMVDTYFGDVTDSQKEMIRTMFGSMRKTQQALEVAKPKIKLHDELMATNDNIALGEFAKLAGLGPKKIFVLLRGYGILMSKGTRKNLPYQRFIDAGYFTVRETPINNYGFEKIVYQTLLTPKGQKYLLNKFSKKDEK